MRRSTMSPSSCGIEAGIGTIFAGRVDEPGRRSGPAIGASAASGAERRGRATAQRGSASGCARRPCASLPRYRRSTLGRLNPAADRHRACRACNRTADRVRADADRPRGQLRPLPRPRDDDDVRQPRLDRAADARRLPRRLPLRARPAGGGRGRDGRRLRPGLGPHHASSTSTPRPASATRWGRSSTPRPTTRRCWSPPASRRGRRSPCRPTSPTATRSRMPHPLVKWSYEPPRAEDVPLALAHGAHLAALPPRGPVFVSMPMDDWYAEVDEADAARRDRAPGRRPRRRRPRGGRAPSPSGSTPPPTRSSSPAPTSTPAAAGTPRSRSPSASACRSGPRPATGRRPPRLPRGPPATSAACCRRRSARSAQTLEGHDLILVVGSSVFPYYPHIPGPLLPEGATLVAITSDPDEAARAPMGDAIVADVGLTLEALLAAVPESAPPGARAEPAARSEIPAEPTRSTPRPSTRRSPRSSPRTAIVVLESPSSTLALRNQLRLSRPGSYYFGAGGGLGFGLAPRSACSSPSPTARSSACSARARPSTRSPPSGAPSPTRSPVTFLVLRNEEYAILKWFAEVEEVDGRARPRPAGARRRRGRRRLRRRRAPGRAAATRSATRSPTALASSQPELVEVPVAPGCPCSRWRRWPQVESARARAAGAGRRTAPPTRSPAARRSRCAASSRRCSAPTASSPAPATSSATPPTPAPTGCCPQAVVMARDADDVAKVLAYGRAQRHPGHLPRRRHQPQRPGPERRHPRRRPPPLRRRRGRGRRRAGPGQARHGARPRQPRARPARPQARPRPGQHRHRHRRRRDRQQLGRDALRRRPRTPTRRCAR